MAMQELNIYALWAGKQTAKGTRNSAPGQRFKQLSGGFNTNREDGRDAFSDATAFVDGQDFVNSIIGNGTPPLLATPEETAWLLWLFHGGETTRAITGPPIKTQHTTVPLPGLGHWGTFVERIGSQVIDRNLNADCQIGQLAIEGSTANKSVRITPTAMALDPGEKIAADPAQAMPTKRGYLYTDGTSRFRIDGTVFRGHSQFTVTINKDLQPVYSDDVTVYDLATGNMTITVGVSIYLDADGLAFYNQQIYGSASPSAGTKPLKTIPALGSYTFDLQARDSAGVATGDTFLLTMAGVKWTPPTAPEANPGGGPAEIALAGEMRKVTGRPPIQIDINNDAAAFTV